MAKNSKYRIGLDNDTAETARHQAIGMAAQYLADVWRRFLYPVPFDRAYNIGGTRVRIVVEEDDAAHERALAEGQSDRSSEA